MGKKWWRRMIEIEIIGFRFGGYITTRSTHKRRDMYAMLSAPRSSKYPYPQLDHSHGSDNHSVQPRYQASQQQQSSPVVCGTHHTPFLLAPLLCDSCHLYQMLCRHQVIALLAHSELRFSSIRIPRELHSRPNLRL